MWGQWEVEASIQSAIHLTRLSAIPNLKAVEVSFPIELQTKLARLAPQQGRDSNSLVVEAVERLVDYDRWFKSEVEKGLTQIEQGNNPQSGRGRRTA